MKRMTGRTGIVTGAASGIGRATAMLLAAEGGAVVVADLDAAGATATAAAIETAGGRARAVTADVTDSDACRHLVEVATSELGGLDVVVNSAGIIRRSDVVGTSEQEWDAVMAVNVRSIFLLGKHAVPVMAAAGRGVHRQHRLRLGPQGGRQRRQLLRVQGCRGQHDAGDGHRPWAGWHPRQLRLSRRHGHPPASLRGPAAGRGRGRLPGRERRASARPPRNSRGHCASRPLPRI